MIQALAVKMSDNNIRPELEAFDLGMINYAKYLIAKGLIKPPYYFNIILGNIACAQANMLSFGLMEKELPDQSIWSGGGVGDSQLKINIMALLSGGGIRIGLEDNIWYNENRTELASNMNLLKRINRITETLEMEPYNHKETRLILGL